MKVDYIIRGGRVIDPSTGVNETKDIYIRGMRIVDVAGLTPECDADRIIDASGKFVPPGLIDFHTHLYPSGYDDRAGYHRCGRCRQRRNLEL